jgi:hypothetical protein
MSGSIQFRSDPNDYIGGGKSWTFGAADGLFTARMNNSSDVSIHFRGDDSWDFIFDAPEGERLAPGNYLNATRAPFHSPVKPGLEVSGAGRGCNTLAGQFNIRQIRYTGLKLERLLVDFEQHCEGGAPALYGTVDLTAK